MGTNFNYDINKNLRLNVGVSNILDKQIYRSSEGANTYNEPAGLIMPVLPRHFDRSVTGVLPASRRAVFSGLMNDSLLCYLRFHH